MFDFEGVGHMGGMWLWWLIAIIVVAAFTWASVRFTSGDRDKTTETAEEILKRRYAAGEIDREEYERRLRDLRQ